MLSISHAPAVTLAAVRGTRAFAAEFGLEEYTHDECDLAALRRGIMAALAVRCGAPRCFVARDVEWDDPTYRPDKPGEVVFITAKRGVECPVGMMEISTTALAPYIAVAGSWPSACVMGALREFFTNEGCGPAEELPFLVHFDAELALARTLNASPVEPATAARLITTSTLSQRDYRCVERHGTKEHLRLLELFQVQPPLLEF